MWLHFIKFVCQNERIGTLRAGAPAVPPLDPPLLLSPLKISLQNEKYYFYQIQHILFVFCFTFMYHRRLYSYKWSLHIGDSQILWRQTIMHIVPSRQKILWGESNYIWTSGIWMYSRYSLRSKILKCSDCFKKVKSMEVQKAPPWFTIKNNRKKGTKKLCAFISIASSYNGELVSLLHYRFGCHRYVRSDIIHNEGRLHCNSKFSKRISNFHGL